MANSFAIISIDTSVESTDFKEIEVHDVMDVKKVDEVDSFN